MAKNYEYKMFRLSVDPQSVIGYGDPHDLDDLNTKYSIYIHKTLDDFGSQGWELVQISGHLVTMKRSIQ